MQKKLELAESFIDMKKILVVGQTPPPFGGQAIMIKALLDGAYKQAKLFHVRMSFSKEMDDMGKFALSKVFHLVKVIIEMVYYRVFHNVRILYYPPCGPDKLPMLRDLAILCMTRWMFQKTIFHFHAAGISDIYPALPWYLKFFFRWGYFKPDVAIRLSEHNPDDGTFLDAQNHCLVPNGIVDGYLLSKDQARKKHEVCTLLSVGLICESKGILVLIDVMRILAERELRVRAKIVGKFESPEFEETVLSRIEEFGLVERFEFLGVLTGSAKYQAFIDADIFCFPTFFQSESFGLVVAEAMQFELPVVASRWRGVQSLIVDGETGFLTPARDSEVMANRVEQLVFDSGLRSKMGLAGRQRYLDEYSIVKFHERMDHCFSLVSKG